MQLKSAGFPSLVHPFPLRGYKEGGGGEKEQFSLATLVYFEQFLTANVNLFIAYLFLLFFLEVEGNKMHKT